MIWRYQIKVRLSAYGQVREALAAAAGIPTAEVAPDFWPAELPAEAETALRAAAAAYEPPPEYAAALGRGELQIFSWIFRVL